MNQRQRRWSRWGALLGLIFGATQFGGMIAKSVSELRNSGEPYIGFWAAVAVVTEIGPALLLILIFGGAGWLVGFAAAPVYERIPGPVGDSVRAHPWRYGLSVVAVLFALVAYNAYDDSSTAPVLEWRWSTPVTGARWGGMPAVTGGLLIIQQSNGLAAFDTATGALRWRARFVPDPRGAPAKTIVINNGVACLSGGSPVGCASIENGRVTWSARQELATDAAGATDGDLLFSGTRDDRVVARSMTTGNVEWITDLSPNAPVETQVFGVVTRGDTVYATETRPLSQTGDGYAGDLVALDARTGRELWRYSTPPGDTTSFRSAPLLQGNLAVVNGGDGGVRAIDLTTHREVWRSARDRMHGIFSDATLLVVGDTVFAGSNDESVYALDLHTGALRWSADLQVGSLSGIALCDDEILALSAGRPFAFDRRTSRVARPELTDDDEDVDSDIAVEGTSVYMVGDRGTYAFRCARPRPRRAAVVPLSSPHTSR